MPPEPHEITLRTDLRPGDLGMIAHLHGVLYAREHGLDTTFEPYVARPLSDFVLAGPDAGRMWIAERGGNIVGSIAAVRIPDSPTLQLRWFLIAPEARGTGLGRRLMDAATGYCRAQGAPSVFLWSFDGLDAALHLYRAYGFVVTERVARRSWGRDLVEVRMDLALA